MVPVATGSQHGRPHASFHASKCHVLPRGQKRKSPAGVSPCRARSDGLVRRCFLRAGWNLALTVIGAQCCPDACCRSCCAAFPPDPITLDLSICRTPPLWLHQPDIRNVPRHALPDRNLRHRAHAPVGRRARRLQSASKFRIFCFCRFDGARRYILLDLQDAGRPACCA